MRDETIKKLDELIADHPRMINQNNLYTWEMRWRTLRAELVAERCENCKSWHTTIGLIAICMTAPKFCCSHFEKKG